MSDQPYPKGNPWHLEGIQPEYDPSGQSLLKEARAVGTEVKLLVQREHHISREIAQVVQDQWTTVGFKVIVEILDTVP